MGMFGDLLQLSTYGESHGLAYGGILSGFPAGIVLDLEAVQYQLNRRRPGQSSIVTQRQEVDEVEFLSGIFEGKSTGAPIGFQVLNKNFRSKDYDYQLDTFRPSHADLAYHLKYGIRDPRGGGRASARETLNWVIAGALARQLIPDVEIYAWVSSVGDLSLDRPYQTLDFSKIDTNDVRCPDLDLANKMKDYILKAKKEGDTLGGTITCLLKDVPAGLGEPVFDKLQARLAYAMLSINACKGFEYGSGFGGTKMKGSEHNDHFNSDGTTRTNLSGGIQGGISNGEDIYFKLAFKPVATLLQPQQYWHREGRLVDTHGRGRHDPCVLPRAVPIVENLAAFVLADALLKYNARRNTY